MSIDLAGEVFRCSPFEFLEMQPAALREFYGRVADRIAERRQQAGDDEG